MMKMSENDRYAVDRRTALKYGFGTVVTSGLAGCTGDGGSEGGDGGDGGSDGDDGGDGGGDDFPTEEITIYIPYGPGGGYDAYGHAIANFLPRHLPGDASVVAQNVAGAGGRVAVNQVYNGKSDGHLLTLVNGVNHPRFQVNPEYDVDYDVTEMPMIGRITQEPRIIGVHERVGVEQGDFEGYVEAVKNEELKFYSTGPGSNSVVIPAIVGAIGGFYDPAKVLENNVAYAGKGEGAQGLQRDDINAACGGIASLEEMSEDLNYVLFIVDQEEVSEYPDVPTIHDDEVAQNLDNPSSLAGMAGNIRLMGAPPGVPDDRLSIIRDAFEQTLKDEEFIARMDEIERPVVYGDHEVAENVVQSTLEAWQSEQGQDLLEQLYDV